MPRINGLLETALYVEDMARSVAFFRDILMLSPMLESDRLTAFDAGTQGVLLIFKRGASAADMRSPNGIVAGHDGRGPLHIAFAIAEDSYNAWHRHLTEAGVKIRGEMKWQRSGRSLYFEDPDGHELEMSTPGPWPTY